MLHSALTIVAVFACWSADAADLIGRASIIDGDTLEIHGQPVRLFSIDAPGARQTCEAGSQTYRCGQQAALALADRIGQQTVACEPRDTDRYGRIVAVCRAGGEDVNAWLVSQGWALAYRHYSTAYVDEEDVARTARLGVWRGAFTAPWDWRHGERTATGGAPTAGKPTGSASACCKICSKSKACGDACISKTKTCHKATGCACDAQ